jgi:structural maintenance of chromosome 4
LNSDDEDDNDDEENENAAIDPQVQQEEPLPEGEVKFEPGEDPPNKKKPKDKPPANELYTYGAPELSKFKKRELVADAEYLDGGLS